MRASTFWRSFQDRFAAAIQTSLMTVEVRKPNSQSMSYITANKKGLAIR